MKEQKQSGSLLEQRQRTGWESCPSGMYKLCWMFVLGSLAGYLGETIWYYYLRGHLINRQGVLIGPFSPIYGIGFVMLTILLYRFKNQDWKKIWAISAVSLSAFEYLCSYAMEHILGTRAWNYSKQPFNLNGRICLKFTIMWGFLGVLFIKVLYPQFSKAIDRMKSNAGRILGVSLAVFLLLDCLFSVKVSLRQQERRLGLPARSTLDMWVDGYYTDEKLAKIYTEIRVVPTGVPQQ